MCVQLTAVLFLAPVMVPRAPLGLIPKPGIVGRVKGMAQAFSPQLKPLEYALFLWGISFIEHET